MVTNDVRLKGAILQLMSIAKVSYLDTMSFRFCDECMGDSDYLFNDASFKIDFGAQSVSYKCPEHVVAAAERLVASRQSGSLVMK